MQVERTVKRILIVFFGLCFASFMIACGKKEVKPVSQESKLAQEAFQLAETLRNAYLENDRDTLEEHCTGEGYQELTGGLKRFDKVTLTFTPTWVEIKDSSVYLSVSWKGVWTVGTKNTEERGLGIFVLEGSPLKLAAVQRDNPFRQSEER